MHVSIVSHTFSVSLAPDAGVSLDLEHGTLLPLDAAFSNPRPSVLIIHTSRRGIVITMRSGSLSVNGHKSFGLVSVMKSAIVRAQDGNASLSFAVVFDELAQPVQPDTPCDVCGGTIQEEGKRHCNRSMCRACVTLFDEKCPDCSISLVSSDALPETDLMEMIMV